MKKVISLILALVLCLSLCACGGSVDSDKLVGEWESSDGPTGFVLLESGNVIMGCYSLEQASQTGNHEYSGTWEVEGDYLIIHYEALIEGGSIRQAVVYEITDKDTVVSNYVEYTKK